MSVEILTSKVMVLGGEAFGMWLGEESGALVKGICALLRANRREMIFMWGYNEKMTIRKLRRGPSPDAGSASTLNFSAAKTVRNKCWNPLVYDILGWGRLYIQDHSRVWFCLWLSLLLSFIHQSLLLSANNIVLETMVGSGDTTMAKRTRGVLSSWSSQSSKKNRQCKKPVNK